MEDITRLVDALLARHGINTSFNKSHFGWSGWFSCLSRASMLLAPGQPGILALAEETDSPRASTSRAGVFCEGDRMLALFHVTEAEDLGLELARLVGPGNPACVRHTSGRCFVRYAVIEDSNERTALCSDLRYALKSHVLFVMEDEHLGSRIDVASDFPYRMVGSEADSPPVRLEKDVKNRELWEWVPPPASLPCGF